MSPLGLHLYLYLVSFSICYGIVALHAFDQKMMFLKLFTQCSLPRLRRIHYHSGVFFQQLVGRYIIYASCLCSFAIVRFCFCLHFFSVTNRNRHMWHVSTLVWHTNEHTMLLSLRRSSVCSLSRSSGCLWKPMLAKKMTEQLVRMNEYRLGKWRRSSSRKRIRGPWGWFRWVCQNLIRLWYFLKDLRGTWLWVLVGMILDGQLPVGFLDIGLRSPGRKP